MIKQADLQDKILNLITNLLNEFKNTPRMSKVTENKILNILHVYQNPGGPYFPPRELRQLASQASRELFPEGQNERWITQIIFRIAHPWYTTQSIVYHSYSFCMSYLCCCCCLCKIKKKYKKLHA